MTIPELLLALAALAVALLCIWLLGRLLGAQERRTLAAAAPAETPPVLLGQEDRGAVLAAISAAIAEEMGTGVSAIRIVEWKRLS